MEIKFCPSCGNKVSAGAKFCGKCGCSLVNDFESNHTESEKNSTISKQKVAEGIDAAKEGAQKTASRIKKAAEDSQITDKVQSSIHSLNQQPEKKARVLKIGGAVIALIIIVFGWNWFSNKDYRQAMANGDSYFSQGEFGKASEFYQQAHDQKPGDEKATEMRSYAQELGNYWTMINEDDGFPGSRSQTVEEIEGKANQIKDKMIKAKYTEAAEAIKNSDQYKLEERIGKKYEKAYNME
ncbi:zinc ribbon domain-containing protein [Enterococcus hulanensis]|uniref:zinc ribbon domain-containing protein n=1 Tax=Enterococcus TaxID=1350 RepID=UPI000B5ABB50|nr:MULTISPECIES: zinc ribbon domain-containing protein [Enterococcus]MBO0409419.1 zinc ribbon domain-containing protein [Enterococcus hulanensis]OTO21702.1 hypothetical protein A5875_003084 [Enterococcus sp. 3H8_DIV0648]